MFIIKQAYINKFKQLDARGFFLPHFQNKQMVVVYNLYEDTQCWCHYE